MSEFDEILEEIKTVPLGVLITDESAQSIAKWYDSESVEVSVFTETGAVLTKDLFWLIIGDEDNYFTASTEEKVILDALGQYLVANDGMRAEDLESLWLDAGEK